MVLCLLRVLIFSLPSLAAQTDLEFDSLPEQYRQLFKALGSYQKMAEKKDWLRIPEKKDSLDLRTNSRFVQLLRRRLEKEDYLRRRVIFKSDSFDLEVIAALKDFQREHGIAETGFPGPQTLAALNISAEERVKQSEWNLQRWKSFHPPATEYILVNIPNFEMQFYQKDKVILSMRVVVGKKDRQTPVFSAKLTHLVLNPTWHIPPTILRKDVLSNVQKNPFYLQASNMRVYVRDSSGQRIEIADTLVNWRTISSKQVPYEVIQEAGSDNALGQVKFIFPNTFSVYMHDSPAKKLFNAIEPLFSSGCVRLAEALTLASFLLEREGWSQERLSRVLQSGRTETVVLRQPVMVYLQYFTCWVDEAGRLQFRPDYYSRYKGH